VCPPQCIWIQRATDDKGRPKARPAGFWIDVTICMSCGYCAEFCPFDAIKMNQEHETVTTDRDRDMFFDLEKLLVPVETYAELHPTDFTAEEEVRRAKEETKRKAVEAKTAAAAEKKAEAAAKNATAVAEEPAEKPAAPAKPDDLKRVEGIGPKISDVLQAAGITTFAQLADTSVDRINQILEEADPRLLRLAHPASWPQQARLAATGKWDELEHHQKTLKRGRKT
jgi:predicted flap endonuclease-1-like 5' DNA nuclease/NAD-dependent dihydropyrimidine dehydrogenase PreA subunit